MSAIDLTKENFNATVEKGIVFLDFWAPWCGPCKFFKPIFEEAAKKHPDAVFGKINTQEQPELAETFQIRSIPTLMVIRDGIALYQEAGALPAQALEDLILQVKALDMDEVRKKIKEEK